MTLRSSRIHGRVLGPLVTSASGSHYLGSVWDHTLDTSFISHLRPCDGTTGDERRWFLTTSVQSETTLFGVDIGPLVTAEGHDPRTGLGSPSHLTLRSSRMYGRVLGPPVMSAGGSALPRFSLPTRVQR